MTNKTEFDKGYEQGKAGNNYENPHRVNTQEGKEYRMGWLEGSLHLFRSLVKSVTGGR